MSEADNKSENKRFKFVPSELRLSQKWDYSVETFIKKAAIGGLVAGLASIVIFSK